jgi:hypothetical protein
MTKKLIESNLKICLWPLLRMQDVFQLIYDFELDCIVEFSTLSIL